MNNKQLYNNEEENFYTKETDASHRKSLGQFFTPYKIASFMSQWILGAKKQYLRVLDPAVGLGIFERAIENQNETKKIEYETWDIDSIICSKLKKIFNEMHINAKIENSDFLELCDWENKYDGIIANPPYYKHHFINNKEKIFQKICVKTYYQFSIQTNIYCWFLIKSIKLLAENGRLAFIIPSEFMNSNYGEKVKSYLLDSGVMLHLININFTENVFDNAMTTSVIILAEKKANKHKQIKLYNVSSLEEITDLDTFLDEHESKTMLVSEMDPKAKWRNYFNGNSHTIEKLDKLIKFSEIGRFSRGIATGANNYFTLSPEEVEKNKLNFSCLKPCITKSVHAKKLSFTEQDLKQLITENKKCYLFDGTKSNDQSTKEYIKSGESLGVNEVYLTKNRDPWYAVEKREVSKIWVAVFGRNGLKFVWNETNALNLTCFHSFYPTEKGREHLDILFIYLNTKTAKKLLEREKREYGNGLSKFEPNDINKSFAINLNLLDKKTHNQLRELQIQLIENQDSENIEKIIEKADKILTNYLQ